MEITVLASGSSGNAYHVTDGVTPLLLEAGIPFPEIRRGLGFGVSGLAGCLLSHDHGDHARAVRDVMRAGVDVFASRGTIGALRVDGHRLAVIRAREQFQLGTWTILPFETEHDAAEPLGFLLANQAGEKLLYATDTYYIRYRFQGLSHIMIECNYAADILRQNVQAGGVSPALRSRIVRSHMSLETLKGFLRANDLRAVQEIWLLHLSNDNSDAERFRREVEELTGKPVRVA